MSILEEAGELSGRIGKHCGDCRLSGGIVGYYEITGGHYGRKEALWEVNAELKSPYLPVQQFCASIYF